MKSSKNSVRWRYDFVHEDARKEDKCKMLNLRGGGNL